MLEDLNLDPRWWAIRNSHRTFIREEGTDTVNPAATHFSYLGFHDRTNIGMYVSWYVISDLVNNTCREGLKSGC